MSGHYTFVEYHVKQTLLKLNKYCNKKLKKKIINS